MGIPAICDASLQFGVYASCPCLSSPNLSGGPGDTGSRGSYDGSLIQGSNTGDVQMNGVIDGGLSCWRMKLGGVNDGICGPDSVIAAWIAGPPRVIVLARQGVVPGATGAWNEMHGTTDTGPTLGTRAGVGMLIVVPLGPVTPITAPAGSAPASKKILAMANAIISFTLITIPSLVKLYSTRQNKKLI